MSDKVNVNGVLIEFAIELLVGQQDFLNVVLYDFVR